MACTFTRTVVPPLRPVSSYEHSFSVTSVLHVLPPSVLQLTSHCVSSPLGCHVSVAEVTVMLVAVRLRGALAGSSFWPLMAEAETVPLWMMLPSLSAKSLARVMVPPL